MALGFLVGGDGGACLGLVLHHGASSLGHTQDMSQGIHWVMTFLHGRCVPRPSRIPRGRQEEIGYPLFGSDNAKLSFLT